MTPCNPTAPLAACEDCPIRIHRDPHVYGDRTRKNPIIDASILARDGVCPMHPEKADE